MTEMLSWNPPDAARRAAAFDLFTRNPFGMLDSIQRLFDDANDTSAIRLEESGEDSTLVVCAELPGIAPDKDVDLTVADGVLTISARREENTENRNDGSYRSEFRYGSMLRRIALPEGATEEDVKASYKDGILKVRAPMPRRNQRRNLPKFPSPEAERTPVMMTDTLSDRHIQYAVEAELRWTPDVEATHIGVSVDNHAVTLTGAVGSYPERIAARRVMGVSAVADDLTVHYAGAAVTDSDIAESVGSMLERNEVLPHGAIQASVRHHQVTLTGHLPSMSEKKQAGLTAWSSPGVGSVLNNIQVDPM